MKILKVNSSGAKEKSISRKEVNTIVSKLLTKYPNMDVVNRGVAYDNLPFPSDRFIEAIFHHGELTNEQKKVTQLSNELVDELMRSDILVIGAPMYNFGIPAGLKAYFDLTARAGKTFQYNEQGFHKGLVNNKKQLLSLLQGECL